MSRFNVACIQVNAGTNLQDNLANAGRLICEARSAGANLVLLPENVAMMQWGRENLVAHAFAEEWHPGLMGLRELARETGLWLHTGTLHIRLEGGKLANRSYLLTPNGGIAAAYDKIHLFDVDLGNGEYYHESATFAAGERAVVAPTPWGKLGLTICYDLRFPQLFRSLAKSDADFIAVPAAFTETTGRAHWHVLLRARAIETGCYIFAPAQCGTHAGGRQTYGHSLIVSPWGQILADGGVQPGFIMAEIDTDAVAEARGKIPALRHDRTFFAAREG